MFKRIRTAVMTLNIEPEKRSSYLQWDRRWRKMADERYDANHTFTE